VAREPIDPVIPIDRDEEFEGELRQAFARRPAPPSLKRRILDARSRRRADRQHRRMALWQRLAACLVAAAALGGGFAWHHAQEERRGEEARQQVMTALRITNRALNEMNARLAERRRDGNE
jgi:type VI protein secretion system component VasK